MRNDRQTDESLRCLYCGHLQQGQNETEKPKSTSQPTDSNKKEDTKGGSYDSEKPDIAKIASYVAIGVGALLFAPCAIAAAAGFGAGGIVAGSVAAATQSSIGSVAAGSAFATLQSLGATGSLVTGMYGGGAVMAAGAAGAAGKQQQSNEEKEASKNNGSTTTEDATDDREDEKDETAGSSDEPPDETLASLVCPYCGRSLKKSN
ncbi:hypothetical protein ACA910_017469 [Epithemia clementina (nom. ined.)]